MGLDDNILKRLKGLVIKRPGLAVGLWGEAGIGKTHSAKRLLHETPCKSLSLHVTTSLSSLAKALPKPKALPVWATRLLEKLEQNQTLSTEQSVSAIGAVLSSIAPFILHLEDLHEANPERLEWVQALASMVTRLKGVALIVTSRTAPPEPFEAIRLETLEFESVKLLLETEANAALPFEAIEWIHGKAAGNPLFTLEFFRYLARLGFVWNDGKTWHWRAPTLEVAPTMVEVLIEQQMKNAAFTPELQLVLASKTILPKNTNHLTWAMLANVSPQALEKAKIQLEQNGILIQGEFIHPLYQEIYKQCLTSEQRLSLARRALELFKTDAQTHALFVADARLEPEQALHILCSAAWQLETRGELVAAAHIRVQALTHAGGETRNQLALEAARDLMTSPDNQQVIELLEQAASSLESDIKHKALVLLAEYHARAGLRTAMNTTIERLPVEYKNGLEWFSKYIHVLFDSGDYDTLLEHWKEHLELLSNGLTMYQVAYSLIEKGNLQDAKILANTFLASNPSFDDQASALDVLATIAFYEGDYAQADQLFTQLLNVEGAQKNIKDYSNRLRNRAVNRLQLGLYQESLPDFEESIRLDTERGLPVACAQTKVMVSAVYLETGRFEQAEQVLLEALEVLKPIPPQSFLIFGLGGLALLYLRWQPVHGNLLAQKYASECLQIVQSLGTPVLQANVFLYCSEVETQTGNPQRGLEYAEQSLMFSKQVGFSEAIMNAHLARASALHKLGHNFQALTDLQTAEKICLETGLILEHQKTLLEIDHMNNDLLGAKQRLDWFESKGFVTAANTVRRYFPDLNSSNATPTFELREPIRLEVLGTLQIKLEGKSQTIRGRKRQEFLALLLEARIAGRSEVNRLELLDALYPNEPEDRATSSLKELVRGTRSSLGNDTIQTTTGGYALGNITSDAEEFFNTSNSSLWRGAYLAGIILKHGFDSVRESLSLALFNAAKMQLESNPKESARVSKILLEMESYNLSNLHLCVQAFRASGNHKSLVREYGVARGRLLEVGEVLPERWQDFTDPQSAETASNLTSI